MEEINSFNFFRERKNVIVLAAVIEDFLAQKAPLEREQETTGAPLSHIFCQIIFSRTSVTRLWAPCRNLFFVDIKIVLIVTHYY